MVAKDIPEEAQETSSSSREPVKPLLIHEPLQPIQVEQECCECGDIVARWRRPQGDRICSLCYLYDVTKLGHTKQFRAFAAAVGEEKGEAYQFAEHVRGGMRITSVHDVDLLLASLVLTTRMFGIQDVVKAAKKPSS
jgi:hypothetical protein